MDTLKERSALERRYFHGRQPVDVVERKRTHEDSAPMPTVVPGLAPTMPEHGDRAYLDAFLEALQERAGPFL